MELQYSIMRPCSASCTARLTSCSYFGTENRDCMRLPVWLSILGMPLTIGNQLDDKTMSLLFAKLSCISTFSFICPCICTFRKFGVFGSLLTLDGKSLGAMPGALPLTSTCTAAGSKPFPTIPSSEPLTEGPGSVIQKTFVIRGSSIFRSLGLENIFGGSFGLFRTTIFKPAEVGTVIFPASRFEVEADRSMSN